MKIGTINKQTLIGCALMALPLYGSAAENKNVAEVALGDIDVTDKRDKFESEFLDRQQIARFRGTANGDAFSGISGVQVNSLRNEAGAIDIGIRGVQGKGACRSSSTAACNPHILSAAIRGKAIAPISTWI